ncbi:MAG: hypothetical protein ACI9ES_000452 [Oceanospirillaceae bacterium]|jgi:hypothetical protein
MQISVSELLKTGATQASPNKKEFNKLWKRIGSLKKSNITFTEKLAALVVTTAPAIRRHELAIIANLHLLITKKLKFLAMKSLSRYNRGELGEWIEESFNLINTYKAEDVQLLEQQVARYNEILEGFYGPLDQETADENEVDEDEDDEPFNPELFFVELEADLTAQYESERAEFIESLDDASQHSLFGLEAEKEAKITAYDEAKKAQYVIDLAQLKAAAAEMFMQEGIFDEDGLAEQDAQEPNERGSDHHYSHQEHFEQDKPDSGAKAATDKLKKLLETANIPKMFRQIAKKLHPDREQDPEQRLIKQDLMAKAIQAREDGDILVLFDLYTTYVDQSELFFNDEQLKSINALLKVQITQVQAEKQGIIESNEQYYKCYHLFYASSAKKTQTKINTFEQESVQEVGAIGDLANELKNLGSMKDVLRDRAYAFNPFNFEGMF